MNWLAEKIEQWPTARLLPYARNARTHSDEQVAQIAASIAEFGFTNPILAGSDGIIVAGHGRLAAAQKLGLEIVPVAHVDEVLALALSTPMVPIEWSDADEHAAEPVPPSAGPESPAVRH